MAKSLRIGGYEVNQDYKTKLGGGSFSQVWRGRIVSTNEAIAVKEIQKPDDPEFTKKYIEQEIKILKLASHPNIIKFYHDAWVGKVIFLFMEYCEERDLDQFIKINKKLSEDVMLHFMQGVADAIDYLHHLSTPIIHRDLKPANLLVKKTYGNHLIKVADFSVSHPVTHDITLLCGSSTYWAPELLPDKNHRVKYNVEVDIFAMGVIFLALANHKTGHQLTPIKGTCNLSCHNTVFSSVRILQENTFSH